MVTAARWRERKRFAEVLGRRMAYVDEGSGRPVLFVHGNPTSSFLWREVIAQVSPAARCIAPDLIGMGDSDKLAHAGAGSYGFVEHRRHLDALIEALALDQPLVLVVHDWGSALGFDWARRHPRRVAGVAYMEALVRPLSWPEWNEAARPIFEALRSPAGEEMILDRNLFVERVLPASVLRTLDDAEMAEYRRPFAEPGEGRRPTLSWPRQIPLDGEPPEVTAIASDYAQFMAQAPFPKLFVNAEPGAILCGAPREFCRSWPAQREVTVRGGHFLQEDSGAEIGRAVAGWLAECVP